METTDIKTVSQSFIHFLEGQLNIVFGADLFLNQVPETAPDEAWWIITNGGNRIQKLPSGEQVKQYSILVNQRNRSGKTLEESMFALEELLNCSSCVKLEGFEVYDIEATQFPSDSDLDDESRRVGMLSANIKIYKKEC